MGDTWGALTRALGGYEHLSTHDPADGATARDIELARFERMAGVSSGKFSQPASAALTTTTTSKSRIDEFDDLDDIDEEFLEPPSAPSFTPSRTTAASSSTFSTPPSSSALKTITAGISTSTKPAINLKPSATLKLSDVKPKAAGGSKAEKAPKVIKLASSSVFDDDDDDDFTFSPLKKKSGAGAGAVGVSSSFSSSGGGDSAEKKKGSLKHVAKRID